MFIDSNELDKECICLISIKGRKRSERWMEIVLEGSEVENLVHELGHLMHSSLSRHKYSYLTNHYMTDYAEMIALLFEYLFATNIRTHH